MDRRWMRAALALGALGSGPSLAGASSWSPLRRRGLYSFSPRERLAAVPVFFVANGRGSPYLLNRDKEGVQECLIFIDPADAETLVDEMTQASPQLTDARVFCIGLDRALAMAQRKPVPSGNVDRNGRELILRYRIQPAQVQVDAAKRKLPGVQKKAAASMIPCFVAPELEATRGGAKTTPVFLALEDLKATYSQVYQDKKTAPGRKEPRVMCYNLIDLILSSEQVENVIGSDFGKLIFFPMPGSVDYVRNARRRGGGSARLHAKLAESP